MKTVLKYLLLGCLSLNIQARELTEEERKWFITTQVLTVVDWIQTRDIVTDPDYWERNPMIGRRPQMGNVNGMFIASLIGNYYLTHHLDEKRMLWLQVHTAVRGATVINNYNLGLGIRF